MQSLDLGFISYKFGRNKVNQDRKKKYKYLKKNYRKKEDSIFSVEYADFLVLLLIRNSF